jgi:tRNA threonylcarbamoyl adenosine modification protein (Sua5/YciO/YrdC/YwlC family)
VLPTDTVYGIGTSPGVPGATERLFEAKVRSREVALPVLVRSVNDAERLAQVDDRAAILAAACWPGALTIVLPRTEESRSWDLGGDPATIGLRVPAHPLAVAVLAGSGPLAMTSANRSGTPPLTTCADLQANFGDLVAIYLCDERPLEGASSTVIDLARGDARVLRRGGVSVDTLRRLLPREGPLLDSRPSS